MKRLAIVSNALRHALAGRKNHEANLAPLEAELQKLIDSSIPQQKKIEAREVLAEIRGEPSATKKSDLSLRFWHQPLSRQGEGNGQGCPEIRTGLRSHPTEPKSQHGRD